MNGDLVFSDVACSSHVGHLIAKCEVPPSLIMFYASGQEILRLDADGMVYRGVRIEDAGEAHKAFLETMKAMQEANRRFV